MVQRLRDVLATVGVTGDNWGYAVCFLLDFYEHEHQKEAAA